MRPQDVCLYEGRCPQNASVDVGFSREIHDRIDHVLLHNRINERLIADIPFHKVILGIASDVFQILQIPRVGELVKVHDGVGRVRSKHITNKVTPDETCTSCDQKILHLGTVSFYRLNPWLIFK